MRARIPSSLSRVTCGARALRFYKRRRVMLGAGEKGDSPAICDVRESIKSALGANSFKNQPFKYSYLLDFHGLDSIMLI